VVFANSQPNPARFALPTAFGVWRNRLKDAIAQLVTNYLQLRFDNIRPQSRINDPVLRRTEAFVKRSFGFQNRISQTRRCHLENGANSDLTLAAGSLFSSQIKDRALA